MRSYLLSAAAVLGLAAAGRAEEPKPQPKSALVTRTYPVADLIAPVPGLTAAEVERAFASPGRPTPADRPAAETRAERTANLLKIVREMVRPYSWAEPHGGPGRIDFHDLGSTLVLTNTPDVLREAADLLEALRRLNDLCVSTEVRFVAVPAGFAARVGLTPADGRPVTLSDRETRLLLEAVRGYSTAAVHQYTKTTTFQGQTAVARFFEGPAVTLRGVVSADRKSVDLKVTAARGEKSAEASAVVPDGGTLVVACLPEGGRAMTTEYGPPVLSRIPYVNRLVKNVGIAPERDIIVLATPRVVIHEEPPAVAPPPRAVPETVTVSMLVAEVPGDFVGRLGLRPEAGRWVLPADAAAAINLHLRQEKARGRVDILSRPTLSIVDGQTGIVEVGQDGGPGVCARVTPRVAAGGGVLLRVEPQVTTVTAGGQLHVEATETTGRVPAGRVFLVRGASRTEKGGTVDTLFFLTAHPKGGK